MSIDFGNDEMNVLAETFGARPESSQLFVTNSFSYSETRPSQFPVLNSCRNITVNCFFKKLSVRNFKCEKKNSVIVLSFAAIFCYFVTHNSLV